MPDLKFNKSGGFNSIDDASKQLGGLGASSIGSIAASGKEAQPAEAKQWDKDYKSVSKILDTKKLPGQSTFIPDEKQEAMKMYGIEPNHPRDAEGHFTYNAVNGKPLKEISKVHGKSRGIIIPSENIFSKGNQMIFDGKIRISAKDAKDFFDEKLGISAKDAKGFTDVYSEQDKFDNAINELVSSKQGLNEEQQKKWERSVLKSIINYISQDSPKYNTFPVSSSEKKKIILDNAEKIFGK